MSFDFVTLTSGVRSKVGRTYSLIRLSYSSCDRWSAIARSHASSASPIVRLESTAGGSSPALIPRWVTRCSSSAASASRRGGERSDVDLDALISDARAPVNLEALRPIPQHVHLDHGQEATAGLRQAGVETG